VFQQLGIRSLLDGSRSGCRGFFERFRTRAFVRVGRAGRYNTTGKHHEDARFCGVTDVSSVDYLKNAEIETWILAQAQACIDGKRIDRKKLSVRCGIHLFAA
jgi:hypothetical protein